MNISGFAVRLPARRTSGFLIIAILVGLCSCNSQPRVASPEALVLIKQAYTACNTKNSQRLAATQEEFDELVAAGTLTDSEQRAFQEIFDLANAGHWEKAQSRAFSFAQSQVR